MSKVSYRTGLNTAVPSREARALFTVLLVMVAVACSSTAPPEVKSYQTIAACNLAVQSGARAFGAIYQANKASDPVLWADRYDKAEAAYNSYEKIRDAAVDAARANGETTLILAAVNEAMNQYLALLAMFGVK